MEWTITCYDEDYSALSYVLDVARTLNIGSVIQLMPKLQDPKNLFSLLQPSAATDARLRAYPLDTSRRSPRGPSGCQAQP
ncbi:hypothetical protein [Pseudomonas sp. GM48]|uniref:hypothetical protein n=1 Tax=Pseudomonas sp. GM48 TaxID=1144330 RepID=UPI0003089B40